jgi:hypothetical protein
MDGRMPRGDRRCGSGCPGLKGLVCGSRFERSHQSLQTKKQPTNHHRNPTRHADKGSRGLPLAYKEHGEGFWALLSQVADRADQEQKEQQQQEAGEASTSGGAGPSSATPLQQQPPPLPWSGAVQGLPQLSAAAQLLWWLRCMELHWATCHHMPTVLGTRAGAADAEVVEVRLCHIWLADPVVNMLLEGAVSRHLNSEAPPPPSQTTRARSWI